MTKEEETRFNINESTYEWCVRSFQAVRKRLGLNVRVHHNGRGLMKKGHIFLFNHFARFETIIPRSSSIVQLGPFAVRLRIMNCFPVGKAWQIFCAESERYRITCPGCCPFSPPKYCVAAKL